MLCVCFRYLQQYPFQNLCFFFLISQVFRCALRRSLSSSLTNDCITAMAEGLHSTSYNHFLALLWGDGDCAYLAKADSCVDSEWVAFSSIIAEICGKARSISRKQSDLVPRSSWEFLIHSKFHNHYTLHTSTTGISAASSLSLQEYDCLNLNIQDKQSPDKSYYTQLLVEILDSLHALYENLKLDNLRKR